MVVIAYDITDNKRLQKVAKFLEKEGIRTQKSLFELNESYAKALKIFQEICKLIDEESDKCFIFHITKKEDIQKKTLFERIF